jgi:catechol 2,3-dioxygenase-like lactoylglutathione lyase family enzyme
MTESGPRLFPSQVCFVVDDVPSAVSESVSRFGWGPFQEFTARIPDARYRDWTGEKVTEVALGMAGKVQVELIRVHTGHDAIESYQANYGRGFQHLGIGCRSRDEALRHLVSLGGVLDDQSEYTGVRFAFVDVPTGPAMFELLESTAPREEAPSESSVPEPAEALLERSPGPVALDRATIVTRDIDEALRFYSSAFRWQDARLETQTLRWGEFQTRARRLIGRAGTLEFELIEPDASANPRAAAEDPYSKHLVRGAHGLVHVGGICAGSLPSDARVTGEWVETGECFSLYDWSGGRGTLQIRTSTST